MYRLYIALILAFIIQGKAIFSQEISIAPLAPDFVKYLDLKKAGKVKNKTKEGYYLGYIPSPVKYIHHKNSIKSGDSLPTEFDLRNVNGQSFVTSVKNQGTCKSCWAFATMGSLESRMLMIGESDTNLSENNLKQNHGFFNAPCEGGNASMSTAYLSRGDGPINESDDNYVPWNQSNYNGNPPVMYITDAILLPDNENVIKQAIYNYGALYTNFFWDVTYYNIATNSYWYFYDDSIPNHAVTLIGWDDNKVVSPYATGAWLVKNSWGDSLSFFFISYQDTKINSDVCFWPEKIEYDSNRIINFYDTLGATGNIGYGSTLCYALIKMTASENMLLKSIGTYAEEAQTFLNIEIYDDFTSGVLTNLLGSICNQTIEYPGFATFEQTHPIFIFKGNDYYIKISYQTPTCLYPLPVEMEVEGYAYPDIESDIFWISTDGINWELLGEGTDNLVDPCIKVYGEKFDTIMPDYIISAEYFLNNDPGFGNATYLPVVPAPEVQNLSFQIDISSLDKGFNYLYVRAKDYSNRWSQTYVGSFYKETVYSTAQNIVKAEYFLNTDPGFGNGINIPVTAGSQISDISFVADISSLDLGFNHLYIRTKDENGKWSQTNVRTFYKETVYPTAQNIVKAEYFFDTDPGFGNATPVTLASGENISVLIEIELQNLTLGQHKLLIRAMDENGKWSIINYKDFYLDHLITLISNPEGAGILSGAGYYETGFELTVSAMPNEGYDFINWTEDGNEVSTSQDYTFTVSEDRTLTANFEEVPNDCFAPESLIVFNTTNTSADLSWTPTGTETLWDLLWGETGFDPASEGTLVEGITSYPYTLDNLNSETDYDFYIRANCGGNDVSEWAGPVSFTTKISVVLDLKVYLEGPFFNGQMTPFLNFMHFLPINQPYNTSPWYYTGNESVSTIPSYDVIDWIYIELIQKDGSGNETVVGEKAGFLLYNGVIAALDGVSNLTVSVSEINEFYIRIHHRNHIAVTSAYPLQYNSGVYSYDFSINSDQAAGGQNAQNEIDPGVWGMISGDANADSQIDNIDKNDFWLIQKDLSGYYNGDFNMDSQVDADDKTMKWKPNAGKGVKLEY